MIEKLLCANPVCAPVLEEADRYEVQILYTQIDRDAANQPRFTKHAFRVNPQVYFYPASTIKLAGALLALEKLKQLAIEGLNKDTPLRINSAYSGQTALATDQTAPEGVPTIGHFIRKLFVVSDNDAYNRLYEFVGQEWMNRGLWEKGYRDLRLLHRLQRELSPEENRHTNPVEYYRGEEVLYRQEMLVNPACWQAKAPILKGRGFVRGGALVEQPRDFAGSNYMSIEVLQDLLIAVFFPHTLAPEKRFDLETNEWRFLGQTMAMLPRESDYPQYDPKQYYDSYAKFFMFGDSKAPIPEKIRIFNKVGLAYGYLTDNAYIVDFEHNIEFLLTATILVNRNEIFNDGNYEYNEVGLPFLAELGRVLYDYELTRNRMCTPDLSALVAGHRL